MTPTELERYHRLYELHLTNLTLQGKRPATIDAYSRAVLGNNATKIAERQLKKTNPLIKLLS